MGNKIFTFIKNVCLFVCLAVCFSCNNDNDTNNPVEQPQIETELQWQLAAIIENGEKLEMPGNYMDAYLIFEEDETFEGRVGANQLKGTFKTDASTGKISMKYSMTQVVSLEPNVIEFEKMYMVLFHKIQSYTYTDSGNDLKLYYGDNSYLEYQSKEVEKRVEQPTKTIITDLEWKLVKLVETGDEVIMPKELLESAKAYVIQFKDDGLFEGFMSANKINGSYTSNEVTEKIELKLEGLTQVVDILYEDIEKMYIDLLFKKVYSYSQTDDGLYLYFGKNSYLKYQALKKS